MFRGKQLPFTMVVFMSLSGRVSGHRLQPRVAASSPQGEHEDGGGGGGGGQLAVHCSHEPPELEH